MTGNISNKRKAYILGMKVLMLISVGITCALVLFLIGYVLIKGIPNISWELVSTKPSYLSGKIGILPDILLFTAGFAHALNGIVDGLFSSGATLTVALYVYAKEQGEFEIAFAIAAILMIMTLLINLLADCVGIYFRRRNN